MLEAIELEVDVREDGTANLPGVPAGRARVIVLLPDGVHAKQTPVPFTAPASPRTEGKGASASRTPEELGWPAGWFEATAGALADSPSFERPSQPPLEERDPLDQRS